MNNKTIRVDTKTLDILKHAKNKGDYNNINDLLFNDYSKCIHDKPITKESEYNPKNGDVRTINTTSCPQFKGSNFK